MKLLKDFEFEPVYFKTRNEIYEEFYKPCMESSIKYDRVSGYFGSSIFVVINRALKRFLENNGTIRLICSPILHDGDLNAIFQGHNEKNYEIITDELNKILDDLYENHKNSTLLLSKLISSNKLEIKLAVYGENSQAYRLMHDKAGIFTDLENNSVCFRGSINETFKGISKYGNSESFDVDTSWGESKEKIRVNLVKEQFNNMWNGKENGIKIFDIPDLTKEKIKSFYTEKAINELIDEITIVKEFNDDIKIKDELEEFLIGETINLESLVNYKRKIEMLWEVENSEIAQIIDNKFIKFIGYGKFKLILKKKDDMKMLDSKELYVVKWGAETGKIRRKIRPYQEEILTNWEKNNRIGLFEMATGSGKTFTTMCAIRDALYHRNETPIIIVPRKILFEQWKKEIIQSFGDEVNLVLCGNGYNDVNSLKIMTMKSNKKNCVIAMMQTASKDTFIRKITQGKHLFLIIDEVHNVGSKKFSNILKLDAGAKIGLSATPKRYRDPEGTNAINNYFDKIIEPKYTLEDAIRDKALCEYFYYPMIINLNEKEKEEYFNLSKEISKKYAQLKNAELSEQEILNNKYIQRLLIKRSKVVKKAQEKSKLVVDIINDKYNNSERWLIYCDDVAQLKEVKQELLKIKKIIPSDLYEYHSESSNNEETIQIFEEIGGILLAINCLDEGVDIPSISNAIILSSSQNERQFIQRRGRVLRPSDKTNKIYSYIYDAIVAPNRVETSEEKYKFLTYELKRAELFAKNAVNKIDAMSKLNVIKIKNLSEINDEGEGNE